MVQKKYDQAFITAFNIDYTILGTDLKYESIQEWDSIGHMTLISGLEEEFKITMDTDDIVDFGSFKKGFEILSKYGIKF